MKHPIHHPASVFQQAVQLSVKLYFALALMCSPIALWLYYEDVSNPTRNPTYWFYPTFIFATPVIVTVVAWLVFIRDTRYRSHDKYRFSRRQFRFVRMPDVKLAEIGPTLESLNYRVVSQSFACDTFELVALRLAPNNLTRFQSQTNPAPHKVYLSGRREGLLWHLTIEGDLLGKIALADFKNTVYDSLEEMLDIFNWRQHLID